MERQPHRSPIKFIFLYGYFIFNGASLIAALPNCLYQGNSIGYA